MATFGEKFKQGANIAAGEITRHNKNTLGDTKKGTRAVYKKAVKTERWNKISGFFKYKRK